jgi:hypothetical protein
MYNNSPTTKDTGIKIYEVANGFIVELPENSAKDETIEMAKDLFTSIMNNLENGEMDHVEQLIKNELGQSTTKKETRSCPVNNNKYIFTDFDEVLIFLQNYVRPLVK